MEIERKEVVLAIVGVAFAVAGLMAEDPWTVGLAVVAAVLLIFYALWASPRLNILAKIGGSAGVLFLSFGVLARDYYLHTQKDLTSYVGTLFPASDPMPQVPEGCPVPKGALVISFGTNIGFAMKAPYTLVEIGNKPLLVLERDNTGRGLVIKTLSLLDDRNDSIVHIEDNNYWVSPNVRLKRPDEHTLLVYDHEDTQVLNIVFLNPLSVSVQGIFRTPGASTLTVQADHATVGGFTLTNSCVGNNRFGVFVQ